MIAFVSTNGCLSARGNNTSIIHRKTDALFIESRHILRAVTFSISRVPMGIYAGLRSFIQNVWRQSIFRRRRSQSRDFSRCSRRTPMTSHASRQRRRLVNGSPRDNVRRPTLIADGRRPLFREFKHRKSPELSLERENAPQRPRKRRP